MNDTWGEVRNLVGLFAVPYPSHPTVALHALALSTRCGTHAISCRARETDLKATTKEERQQHRIDVMKKIRG